MEITIAEILEAFRHFDGNYKREQVDAATELKADITPHLIKILENVLDDPSPYLENENLYDPNPNLKPKKRKPRKRSANRRRLPGEKIAVNAPPAGKQEGLQRRP